MTEIRCAVEVRQDGERRGPGRLVGTLMRYGEQAKDRAERFAAGALRWPEGGVVLNRQHQRGQPITRITPEVRSGAVVLDVPLPDTAAGRDAAAEVRSGLLRGFSVEFRAVRQHYEAGVRVITDALLTAAGLVDEGSYPSAAAEVRRKQRRNLYL